MKTPSVFFDCNSIPSLPVKLAAGYVEFVLSRAEKKSYHIQCEITLKTHTAFSCQTSLKYGKH